jgi:hypothetical protein
MPACITVNHDTNRKAHVNSYPHDPVALGRSLLFTITDQGSARAAARFRMKFVKKMQLVQFRG